MLGGLIVLGLVPVLVGTRTWLWIYVIVLALGGLAGLADFYRWGYEYGHNLIRNAAIQVPGMSYQPPLIGYKNLLNFTAYSGPDIGGWIMIASGGLAGLLLACEIFLRKDGAREASPRRGPSAAAAAAAILMICGLTGCRAGAEPMRYGQDECASCKMIVSDPRFGAQLVTRKGKVLKFDDVGCMSDFIRQGGVARAEVLHQFVSDFTRPNAFIPVEQAFFLKNDELRSPMRSDCAAFASEAELLKTKGELGAGEMARWTSIARTP